VSDESHPPTNASPPLKQEAEWVRNEQLICDLSLVFNILFNLVNSNSATTSDKISPSPKYWLAIGLVDKLREFESESTD